MNSTKSELSPRPNLLDVAEELYCLMENDEAGRAHGHDNLSIQIVDHATQGAGNTYRLFVARAKQNILPSNNGRIGTHCKYGIWVDPNASGFGIDGT